MIDVNTRKRVVEARKRGISVRDICNVMGLKQAAVYCLLKRERETGDITPGTHARGRKSKLTTEQLTAIKNLIDTDNDITLAEIIDTLKLPICDSALSWIIRNKLGYRLKKKHYMPANVTEPMWQPHGKLGLKHRQLFLPAMCFSLTSQALKRT